LTERTINLGSSVVPVTILLALIGQSIFLGRWSQKMEDRQERLRDEQIAAHEIDVKHSADIEYLKREVSRQERDFLMFKDYAKGRIAHLPYREYQAQ
jgi:hypothetical protein